MTFFFGFYRVLFYLASNLNVLYICMQVQFVNMCSAYIRACIYVRLNPRQYEAYTRFGLNYTYLITVVRG